VWLRCQSAGGFAAVSSSLPGLGQTATCEFHHSLAMANLIDTCLLDDGWSALNRRTWSSGAGHTATQCVFWNTGGKGVLRSFQYGWGYVIGTAPTLTVNDTAGAGGSEGTAPNDWLEGLGRASTLTPRSLYVAQYRARTGTLPEGASP